MEVLVLDGKSYVKASKAAKDLGYATDYVGQLCRSGQVDAHLIGRTWYVNPDDLGTHRFEKKRMSRVKARVQAKKAIEERRLKVTEEPKSYKNIDIRYEQDPKELIPETRKIEVTSLSSRFVHEEPEYDQETIIENKGNKVLMSGDLEVVDVTDAPVETDIVTLTPGRIRSGTITVTPRQSASQESTIAINQTDQPEEDLEGPVEHMSFEERLQTLGEGEAVTEGTERSLGEAEEGPEAVYREQDRPSLYPYTLVVLMTILLVFLVTPLVQTIEYSDDTEALLISYDFSPREIISVLKLKI